MRTTFAFSRHRDRSIRVGALVLVVALGLAVGLGACSSSDSDGATTTTKAEAGGGSGDAGGSQTGVDALAKQAGLTGGVNVDDDGKVEVTAPADGKVEVELGDSYFNPAFIHAAGGSTLHLEVTNGGGMPHTFTIDSAGIDEQLAPGASKTVDVEVPESGALRMYCRFHGSNGGMQGAILAS